MVTITNYVNGEDADQDTFNLRQSEIEGHFNDGDDGSRVQPSPAITSFSNAQHDHEDAAGGGKLDLTALAQTGASVGEVAQWNGTLWVPATVDLSVLTTKGDLVGHNGSDPVRLPAGLNGAPLVYDSAQSAGVKAGGANYKFFQHVGALVYASGNTNVADGNTIVMSWDSEHYDSDGFHDPGSNPDRMTIQNTGMHRVYAAIVWDFSSTVVVSTELYLRVNTVTTYRMPGHFEIVIGGPPTALGYTQFFGPVVDVFSAGDFLDIAAYADTSGGQTMWITGGATYSFFGIEYVGTT